MSNGGMNTLEQAAPSQEPSLEVINVNAQNIRDTLSDIEVMILQIEDYLRGARPEKEQTGSVDSCPSGMLAQICQMGANNLDRLQDIHRRLSCMSENLGVQR